MRMSIWTTKYPRIGWHTASQSPISISLYTTVLTIWSYNSFHIPSLTPLRTCTTSLSKKGRASSIFLPCASLISTFQASMSKGHSSIRFSALIIFWTAGSDDPARIFLDMMKAFSVTTLGRDGVLLLATNPEWSWDTHSTMTGYSERSDLF